MFILYKAGSTCFYQLSLLQSYTLFCKPVEKFNSFGDALIGISAVMPANKKFKYHFAYLTYAWNISERFAYSLSPIGNE